MNTLVAKILAAILAVAIAFGLGGFLGYHYTDKYLTAQQAAQVAKLNEASAAKLTALDQARTKIETEQAQQAAQDQKNYEDQITTLNSTVDQLRHDNLVLRDPGTRPSKSAAGNSSVAGSSGSDQQSGSALSSGATDFLLGFAQRADTVRLQLIACQADDAQVRQAVTDYNAQLQSVSQESAKTAIQKATK